MSDSDPAVLLYEQIASALRQLTETYRAALTQLPLEPDAAMLYAHNRPAGARMTMVRAVDQAQQAGSLPYGSDEVIRIWHHAINSLEDMERRYGR